MELEGDLIVMVCRGTGWMLVIIEGVVCYTGCLVISLLLSWECNATDIESLGLEFT